MKQLARLDASQIQSSRGSERSGETSTETSRRRGCSRDGKQSSVGAASICPNEQAVLYASPRAICERALTKTGCERFDQNRGA
eukprot:6192243-Pleurochrysis_carterae.AAC.2